MTRELTNVETREVSYVTRAANRRKFALLKRDIPASERHEMPEADFAGEGESFPIRKPEDVAAAAHSLGRTNQDRDKVKRAIIRIARRKGPAFVAQLPETWKDELGITKGDMQMPKFQIAAEDLDAILSEPVENEDAIVAKYLGKASEGAQGTMRAALRLLNAAGGEVKPSTLVEMAKAAMEEAETEEEAAKRKRKEEEEEAYKARKRKEDEAEEAEAAAKRKRKEAEEAEEAAKRKRAAADGKDDDKPAFLKRKRNEETPTMGREKEAVAKSDHERALEARLEKAEAALAEEREQRLDKAAFDQAGKYGHIAGASREDLATLIRKVGTVKEKILKADEKTTVTASELLTEILEKNEALLAQSAIFTEIGTGVGRPGGAFDQVMALAKGLLTKSGDGKMTEAQAVTAVLKAHPNLYADYNAEREAMARGAH